jgi:hypothetical protein
LLSSFEKTSEAVPRSAMLSFEQEGAICAPFFYDTKYRPNALYLRHIPQKAAVTTSGTK